MRRALQSRSTFCPPADPLLAPNGNLTVGDNEPYSVSETTDYTIPVHGERRGLPHVSIEIRQDLIADDTGQRDGLRFSRVCCRGRMTALKQASHSQRSNAWENEWCPGAELNHRHLHCQCSALPTELPGHTARAYKQSIRACPQTPSYQALFTSPHWGEISHRAFQCGGSPFSSRRSSSSSSAGHRNRIAAGKPAVQVDIATAF